MLWPGIVLLPPRKPRFPRRWGSRLKPARGVRADGGTGQKAGRDILCPRSIAGGLAGGECEWRFHIGGARRRNESRAV